MGKLIALVYFYVISAVSLGLIIIGIFNVGNLVINLTQYDVYPPRYGYDNCESGYGSKAPYAAPLQPEASMGAEQAQRQKELCLMQVELDRKQHKLDDVKNSVLFTSIGIILFLIHFPQARKQSKG